MDKFSFKEMRTRAQSKILSYFIYVRCESEELGGRRSSRFPCVTRVVETSDGVAFRTPSNINYGAPLRKHPTVLTCRLFLQKSSTADFRPNSKCGSAWRYCEWGVWADSKCMKFVAAGCCTRKCLRYYQTLRNLTFGDLGILLVVIRLGVTGLKKTRVVYVLDFFQGSGKTGQFDLVHVERLQVIWLMVAM